MTQSGHYPSSSRVPTGSLGATIVGAATIISAITDTSDASYIHVGTTPDFDNHLFITRNNPGLPTGRRINAVTVYYRTRFLAEYGWIYPANLVGFIGSERHVRSLSAAAPGSGSSSVQQVRAAWTTGAADGTFWDECTSFEIEWYYWGTWNSGNFPYITQAYLVVDYSSLPEVSSIAPSGTITDPQTTVTWAVSNGPQTAYQAVLVPTGSTDSEGVLAGASGFDPETGSGLVYDSAKTFGSSSAFYTPVTLANGLWYVYVRAYTGSGVQERTSIWAYGSFTVDTDTVDTPTVTLADDATSNSVQVTITAGSHTEDFVADLIEVEYLDAVDGWVAAPIPDGTVAGTGSSIFYDGVQAPGATVSYRARGIYERPADNLMIASGWATATHTVGDLEQWWLRAPTDYTANRSLSSTSALLLQTFERSRTRPQSATWGLGARPATVVHDIVKGDTFSLSVWAMTADAYDDLRTLIEGDDDLMLVSQWGEMWRVQVGSSIKEDIVKAAPRPTESTPLGHVRVVSFSLVEVAAP